MYIKHNHIVLARLIEKIKQKKSLLVFDEKAQCDPNLRTDDPLSSMDDHRKHQVLSLSLLSEIMTILSKPIMINCLSCLPCLLL
jgi:hypothetical protein